ncbi:ferredoxin reductase-like protein [Leucogyrophana mollusca]|uniref:Ferredoxin reductase-like protein n=1 Tax=Leucogyrophana mollusca TaxID=85980 RepID=A0ACB8BNV5_9AGAM|nr:ferredoxin reductase-like protein [Leucogyrophana mollusca]
MSFIRAAAVARSVAASSRRYSAQAAAPKSNLPLYLGGAGVLGLGTYVYLGFGKEEPKAAKTATKDLKSPLDPQNFVNFKLKKVEPYNHNTAKFIFELPEGHASLLPIASCVYLKAENLLDAKGKPVYRPYTPISASDAEGELTFIIKKYETGVASKYIHSLKPGDTLAVKGPLPKWPYKINEFETVALIGGGSGIAPLFQILQHALPDKTNKTKFKLIFANVTEEDILLRKELDDWKKKYPDTFDIVYVLDKPGDKWKGPSGFVNADLIKQHVAPASVGDKVKVFICGPPPQMASICGLKDGMKQGALGGILKELGYTEDQVFKF